MRPANLVILCIAALPKLPEKSPQKCYLIWYLGAWTERFGSLCRRLEHKVNELGGKKCLYAHGYYTEEEFWDIYDHKKYETLRSKYHATYLPSVYDKVNVNVEAEKKASKESWIVWLFTLFWSIWPLSGLYGVLHVMIGDYLGK